MVDLWQLTIIGDKAGLLEIESRWENRLEPPLSLSLFEETLPNWKLEITLAERPDTALVTGYQQNKSFQVKTEKLEQKNWILESLRFLTPVIAGRFYVHGSHDLPKENAVSICIPAGMAFGTGHHETTRGCLLEFDKMLGDGHTFTHVLDLGTGAGILAIAAAKTSTAHILATDIDAVAIDVARQNETANAISSPIKWLIADGPVHPVIQTHSYDLIFANILAAPLVDMASSIAAQLAPGGQLILAGLLNEQSNTVTVAYTGRGLKMVRSRSLGDWTILVLIKPVP